MARCLLAATVGSTVALLSANVYAAEIANSAPENTTRLEISGDIASLLVAAADEFLLDQITHAEAERQKYWKRDLSSAAAYEASLEPNRQRLREMLGLGSPVRQPPRMELVTTVDVTAEVGVGDGYTIQTVRWPAFGNVDGEGLLLTPTDREPIAGVVALPHCEVTPEQLVGLAPGLPAEAQYARRLAESGCLVVVPMLVNRQEKLAGISNREWLHRSAYEMGRTLTGYEVQKTLAACAWLKSSADRPIGVMGWGDGGLIAWYAAAVDPQIDAVFISGVFGDLQNLWQQPIDRMLFGLLREFGDAELAAMVAPRRLIVEQGAAPLVDRPRESGERGGPYRLAEADEQQAAAEISQARRLVDGLPGREWLSVHRAADGLPGSKDPLTEFLQTLAPVARLAPLGPAPTPQPTAVDVDTRHARQMQQLDWHTQALLRRSHMVRDEQFWSTLDTTSLEAYSESIEPWREKFYEETIGRFAIELAPPNARVRLIAESPKYRQYEVVLDVFDELFAYGILTIPTEIEPGEQRPVVVCQHGLEGRPQDVIGEQNQQHYKAFATELAERGFVTFAPQNLYIFEDRFRTLQRKANSIGRTLFSMITPQHQQIVNWLKTQSYVDDERIGFYGLSYGGKTAMRVPALVTDYALSICSADFNEWVDKNASTLNPRSYVNTGEYEIFEWNLGHTFNYAEMAALIAPRPFMVERGHHDGVADDWTVAWEYARVRHLYAAKLKRPELTEIEWFDGPHAIHGEGTYRFLHRHLNAK